MNTHVTLCGSISHAPPTNQTEPAVIGTFLRQILLTLPLGIAWQRSGTGGDCWANEAFARLAGQPGMTFTSVDHFAASLHEEDRGAYSASLAQLRTKQSDRIKLELRCPTAGADHWRELTLQLLAGTDGQPETLLLTLADISERKQHEQDMQRAIDSAESLNQQIEIAIDRAQRSAVEANVASAAIRQLAVLDELTGLYNRRGYNTLNPDVIQKVKNSDARGYLCYFDLDRFKQINDELGHAKGDEALVEFSTILRAVFREDALLVRLGGDEFVAMGWEQSPNQSVEDALRALDHTLRLRNSTGTSGFNLEASAGVAYFDKTGPHSIEALTTVADAELYKNKESRRRARGLARTTQPPGAVHPLG